MLLRYRIIMSNALKKLSSLLLFMEAWLYVRVDWVAMLVILKAPDEYRNHVFKPQKGKPKVTPYNSIINAIKEVG